jgi:hypothetical protein
VVDMEILSRRRDAWRWFSSFVSHVFPRLINARNGTLSRRRDGRRSDARRRLSILFSGIPWHIYAIYDFHVDVATLGVGFPASCMWNLVSTSRRSSVYACAVSHGIPGSALAPRRMASLGLRLRRVAWHPWVCASVRSQYQFAHRIVYSL